MIRMGCYSVLIVYLNKYTIFGTNQHAQCYICSYILPSSYGTFNSFPYLHHEDHSINYLSQSLQHQSMYTNKTSMVI